MRQEIFAASSYCTSVLIDNGLIFEYQADFFCNILSKIMNNKYKDHWYIDNPSRGQALRAICIENGQLDTVLIQAMNTLNINLFEAAKVFGNIVLWIDPGLVEVEYFGKNKPSNEILYQQWNEIEDYSSHYGSYYNIHSYPQQPIMWTNYM